MKTAIEEIRNTQTTLEVGAITERLFPQMRSGETYEEFQGRMGDSLTADEDKALQAAIDRWYELEGGVQ
ncbi:hypothetical protein [Marispirochaeta sp.]|uniref:hypothetical protein n=1 Tax=Marispirochaeta sp. TaxID=2038653 RepID=UPI0029C75E78|nr:hypothetical protein [Marispirochaeta sp.]